MTPEQLPPLPEPAAEAAMNLFADHQGPVEACQYLPADAALFTTDQMHAFRADGITAATAALRAELAKIRTVMIAAAEEISEHWDAHCDAEGYGPVNLMHRLEQGIPSEYGYTAGEFARLRAEMDALRRDRDGFKQSLYAELDTNLRLRELGGALADESMTPFLERVIAERDALRRDAERYRTVRRGQHWSIVDGIGDELRAAALDSAIDAAMKRST
jgi:hypothetical protein